MRAVYWMWRRELAVMLRAPIVYLVGGLFLVVQGIAFASLVAALSDPTRAAPLGALLEGQLAGTLLTWVLQLVVLTLLGMRAIAEDKRTGGWELLLTAGVSERVAVLGKWLAAATIYALVWIPTLAYLGIVAIFRVDTGGWDIGALVTGYVGAIVVGIALLAWVIAASAATSSLLAAGALGFGLAIGWFLIGELSAPWSGLPASHPWLATALETISLRRIATGFARGEVALASVVVLAGAAATGLSLAVALACAGRRRTRELRVRIAGTVVIAAGTVLAGVLAVRHPVALDLSAHRTNSLDAETRAVLGELPGPATLTIVKPTFAAVAPVYDEVARVLTRIAAAAPGVTLRRVDPVDAPGGLTAIARAAGLQPGDLASGGAVVVELGGRRRVIDLLSFAVLDRTGGGPPEVQRLAIEQAIAGALAILASPRQVMVCATRGHGELPITAADKGADWSTIADRWRGDGMTVGEVDVVPSVPAACSVVVVIGPAQPLSADEALALQKFVAGGGGLVVAAASRAVDRALPATGLEGMLAAEGLGLPPAIAVDPSLAIRELPGALYVLDGYTDHPIDRGFAKTRPTLWYQPRVVVATGAARPLVSATAASWGERDLDHPPAKDIDDLGGPVALAAIGPHRVIALGSAESFTSGLLKGGASAGDLWVARAVRFAAGVAEPVPEATRSPEQVRLILTDGQRDLVVALSTAGIPLAWGLIGGLIVWRRRRT